MNLFSFFKRKKDEESEDISEANTLDHNILSNNDIVTEENTLPQGEDIDEKLETNNTIEETKHPSNITIEEEILEDYNPRLDLSHYAFPTASLLKIYDTIVISSQELAENKDKIITVCEIANIQIISIQATVGVMDTLYQIVLKSGTRISAVMRIREDLAFALSAHKLRIEPIIEKGTIGIIVPNKAPQKLSLHSIICSKKYQESTFDLPIILGKNIFDESLVLDLAESPHIIVAGTTGQGKSVLLNTMILSLLYKKHPAELKFVLFDLQKVEFNQYSVLKRHFLAKLPENTNPIVSNISDAISTLTFVRRNG